MSKILILFAVFILQLLFLVPIASAATCTFTYSPTVLDQDMDKLTVTITSPDLPANTYRLTLIVPGNFNYTVRNLNFSAAGVSAEFSKPSSGWKGGQHKLYLIKQNKIGDPQNIADCSTTFTVAETSAQSCTSQIENTKIDPDTDVILVINGITSGSYDLCINDKLIATYSTDIGNRVDLSKHPVGTHTVKIKNRDSNCSQLERIQCGTTAFEVAPRGGGGGPVSPPGASPRPAGPPTTSGGPDTQCGSTADPGIRTAIGCVHTSPVGFIKDFLKFILGISGGLAFLMMILGAFQMLTSAGNPDTLNAGRDRLTSAIIGLLFVIFAVLLLQIIGVDILFKGLPGFGR